MNTVLAVPELMVPEIEISAAVIATSALFDETALVDAIVNVPEPYIQYNIYLANRSKTMASSSSSSTNVATPGTTAAVDESN